MEFLYYQAHYRLALLYLLGSGVQQDELKGLTLLIKAAENDHTEAQYLLGSFTEDGAFGITTDQVKALEWYFKACNLGHEMACKKAGKYFIRRYRLFIPRSNPSIRYLTFAF